MITKRMFYAPLGLCCWLVWIVIVSASSVLAGDGSLVSEEDNLIRKSKPSTNDKRIPTDYVDFNRDIQPILSDRCFACHGPDASSREADLRLDLFEAATQELPSGEKAIVPGNAAKSLLIERIMTGDEAYRMPPTISNLHLTKEEQELIANWIEQGAKYEEHWSFRLLPAYVPIPKVSISARLISPIDHFVVSRLEAEGLRPSPAADKLTWLRRVTYDLTGLPPTPEQVDAFVADESTDAFERVVDRLLNSAHFGERMAVPWLDVSRYADSYGYQSDLLCPTWPWRDWVVRAINDNLSYNRFLTWQIAGDLLPDANGDHRLATAFNRLHRMTNEGGSIAEEFRCESIADRVSTLGTAVLGLTVECSRCHDHKFDPLTQREFYALSAMFDNIDEWGTYHDSGRVPTPSLLLPTVEQAQQLETLKENVVKAERDQERIQSSGEPRFIKWLQSGMPSSSIPGLAGHYSMDSIGRGGTLSNSLDPNNPGNTSLANRITRGYIEESLQLVGDEAVQFPGACTGMRAGQEFSISVWLKVPVQAGDGVILHCSGGSDIGYHGTEVSLKNGRIFFGIIRFWPGNAIAVESIDVFPKGRWVHLAITYDAMNSAKGMHLYVDGQRADRVVRDNLYKDPQQGGDGLTFGQRFRGSSVEHLRIDELHTFNRDLTGIEVAQLFDGQSLSKAVGEIDAGQLREYYFRNFDEPSCVARKATQAAKARLLGFQTGLREIMVMEELFEPRQSHVLNRGEYDAEKNDETLVKPGVPEFLGVPTEGVHNRLDLARWLTHPDHPLTARVAVNRVWQVFFGIGLVDSSDNFGTQGSSPSHPELLDWLSRDFVESNWDVKRLCKQITLSATYRQSSLTPSELRERDPRNRLLARGPSGRLSAEMIRDTALAASGLLNRQIGGPPVSPYQPPNLWKESNSMSPAYKQSVGTSLYRRSLYTVVKRTAPSPNMVAFDLPSRETCTARRATTNTPLSALVLLNDVQYVEACRVLAEHMLMETSNPSDQIQYAFLRLVGRKATDKEMAILHATHNEQKALFAEHPCQAEQLVVIGDSPVAAGVDPVELAAATVVAQTILNLDATVWKR